jgi:gamma-glutamylcyclotransferase (GGCT)/AIG2-like uncharacterized protein YtfP
MSWVSTLESDGRLGEAVSHVNEALDLLERDGTEADATRCLSDALNEIRAEWSLLRAPAGLDDAEAFQAMLAQALSAEAQAELLSSDEVAAALGLEPGIATRDEESRARLLASLAELTIVRPDLAHGEKLPRVSDSEKPERDEPVGRVVPLQLLLVNLLLDKPDERLVIYGTLAPGRANHKVIEDLRGSYSDCRVHGRISEVDGLPYFTWAPSADSLGAHLFCSKQLPEKWDDLDRFEGDGYKRRLIPATVEGGLSIASIYMSTADDWWSQQGR